MRLVRHLLLLRHAQAAPALKDQPDQDRPLSERGHVEALDAAHCIADSGLRIDALLVSPAVRTRETATIVAAELDAAPTIRYDQKLYLGEPEVLLGPLRRCDAKVRTVLVVGHNPGLSELAQRCAGAEQSIALRTSGLCRVDFERDSWRGLKPEMASACTVLR